MGKATVTICYSTSIDVEVECEENESPDSIRDKAIAAADDKEYEQQLLHNLQFCCADITDRE